MAVKKEINVRISATDDASKTFRSVGISLESLKRNLGSRSDLKEVGEIFAGGGAVAGATLIGRLLEDFGKAGQEALTAFREGKKDAGQLTAETLTALPVVGQIAKGFRSVFDLAQDTEASLAEWVTNSKDVGRALESDATILRRANEEAKKAEEIAARRAAEQKVRLDIAKDVTDFTTELQRQLLLIRSTPIEAALLAPFLAFEDDLKKIEDRRQRVKLSPTRTSKQVAEDAALLAQLDEDERAAIEKRAEALRKLTVAERDEFLDTARSREQAVQDLRTDSNAKQLRDLGESLQAEFLLLEAAAAKRKQLIDRQTEVEIQKRPFNQAALQDQGERAKAEVDRVLQQQKDEASSQESQRQIDLAEQKRRDADDIGRKRIDFDRQLNEQHIAALETEGDLGNVAAEQEAKRLRIAEEYADKARELQQIVNSTDASLDQKLAAINAQERLPDEQKRAEDAAIRGRRSQSDALPQLIESSFLSGASQLARDNQRDPVEEQLKKNGETEKKIADNLGLGFKAIAAALNNISPGLGDGIPIFGDF